MCIVINKKNMTNDKNKINWIEQEIDIVLLSFLVKISNATMLSSASKVYYANLF